MFELSLESIEILMDIVNKLFRHNIQMKLEDNKEKEPEVEVI